MENPRKTDKIATYIARIIACCIGTLLVGIFIALKIWKTANFEQLMMYGAMTGLCLGYGLGGDVLGAKFFGLFTHLNVNKALEADRKDNRQTKFLSKIILGIAICFIIFFGTVLIIAFSHRPAQ